MNTIPGMIPAMGQITVDTALLGNYQVALRALRRIMAIYDEGVVPCSDCDKMRDAAEEALRKVGEKT